MENIKNIINKKNKGKELSGGQGFTYKVLELLSKNTNNIDLIEDIFISKNYDRNELLEVLEGMK